MATQNIRILVSGGKIIIVKKIIDYKYTHISSLLLGQKW